MQDRARCIPISLAVAILAALVIVVFHPIVGFEFVNLDVGQQVVDNSHIRGLNWDNLTHILTSRCTTSYYPVRSLTFALDYQFWGLNPTGFKLTNSLIHFANVLLLFWLILRFFPQPAVRRPSSTTWRDVSVAAFSAGLFAVHPVVVEPVVWVSGREELLMTTGALGCVHFYLTARQLAETGGRTCWMLVCYGLAVLSCAAACLSNAVAAVIPALIVTLDVFVSPRPTLWRTIGRTAPLWALGVATIVIKKVGEFSDPPNEVEAFSADRLMLALNVYWLNVKTLVWPMDLAVFRPGVTPSGYGDVGVILGGVAMGLTCIVLWAIRRQKFVLLGLLWFGIAMAPSAQIMVHHVHRADRFLYLPLAGLVVAVAMGLRRLGGLMKGRAAQVGITATLVLGLLLLVRLSIVQVRTWQDSASMWENCVRVAPDYTWFRCVLANRLANHGQPRLALRQYEQVLQQDPQHGEAAVKLAWLLVAGDDLTLRDYDRAIRLAERAYARDPLFFRAFARIHGRVAEVLEEEGEYVGAIEGYRLALESDPGNQPLMLQLSLLLATCRDERLRNPVEAVELAERASLLSERPGPREWSILATVYAQAGQMDRAVETAERAAALARAAGDRSLLDDLRSRLKIYREDGGSK